jgi:hypothetical protein
MSSRVRRMALGLATLTLLTSVFLVVQGFLNAPEALAACSERTWCDPPIVYDTFRCCCDAYRWYGDMLQMCYWREVDCTVSSEMFYVGSGCFGSFCCLCP